MELLDAIATPSGREQVTNRPAWRVRDGDAEIWAYIEQRSGRVWVTGYPMYPVDVVKAAPDPVAGAVVGGGAAALVGAAFAGPAGAAVGGFLGAVLGAVVAARQ